MLEMPMENRTDPNNPLEAQQKKMDELRRKFAALINQHAEERQKSTDEVEEARKKSEMATRERIKVTQAAEQRNSSLYQSNTVLKQIDTEKFSIFDSSSITPLSNKDTQQSVEKSEVINHSLVSSAF